MEKDRIIINQLLSQWNDTIEKVTLQLDGLGTWAADKEIAPGRNTVRYLLGHLIAVHDRIIEALELGDRFFPELDELFIKPHNKSAAYPEFVELIKIWSKVNQYLSENFRNLTVEDWLSKHHYVSDADFALEPNRNKLAILLSRYAHLYNHVGQLRLVKQ